MKNPLQIVNVKGEGRELLYTLSLYQILADRHQQVVIKRDAQWCDVVSVMLRIIYAAYINAIEVRKIDDLGYNPEPLKFMDFTVWSEESPKEFGEQLKLCYLFLTGKELDVDVKKKQIKLVEETSPKKSIWSRISGKFRTFSSER